MTSPRTEGRGLRAAALLCLALALAIVVGASLRAQQPPDGWRTFAGAWSASGVRQTLPAEAGRTAAIARLSGALVLSSGGAGSGFAAEAIGFDDGSSETTGRAVWTDNRGDRIFSTLRGEPLQTGRHITGTITGGTGRWSGAIGEYTLTWQYVVAGEGDAIQGWSKDVHGRVRIGEARR